MPFTAIMQLMNDNYLHVGRASDLTGSDRILYRFLEIMPGVLSWGTIFLVIFMSWYNPVIAALFIIVFDIYWVIKTIYLSVHLRISWKKMQHYINTDWSKRLENLKYDHVWQMVVLPFYKEDFEVVSGSISSLLEAKWFDLETGENNGHKKRMIVVLAYEERAGEEAENIAQGVMDKYKDKFAHFMIVRHPKDLPGEMPGKGSNIAWATKVARKEILDKNNIEYENVLLSAFDIDTRVYPQYFLCLTWHFLTCEHPYRSSFQPVPIYNNNIWDAPALSRVVATSGTFWQMIQQERPEKLATFSSHSMSFRALHDAGYWQKNIVSEDSRIFWNSLIKFDGDYRVVPLSYPVSLDANLADSFWQTTKNVYKQQRRWTWGVENAPYILFNFLKNKRIPLAKKLRFSFVQVEGFWSLATNPLIIFSLGWLPLMLGGVAFNDMVLSYNLPRITRDLMTLAMLGLFMSAIISMSFLPARPKGQTKLKYFPMFLQWVLIPFTIPMFGAIPGLDSQMRLLLGKYMGFWVTPKYRVKSQEVRRKD